MSESGEEVETFEPSRPVVVERLTSGVQRVKNWLRSLDPEPFYRFCARQLIRSLYRIDYSGFDKLPKEGPALLIGNHISYIDGLIIQAGSPRPIRFVIDKFIYNAPGVHYFMKHNRAIPIAPTKKDVSEALDMISEAIEQGDLVFIFPEGQLTYSGHLGHFKPGIEWILSRDPVPVYPIVLKGLWGSFFSRKYRKAKIRGFFHKVKSIRNWRRPVSATCLDPVLPHEASAYKLQRMVLKVLYQKQNL